MTTDLIHRLSDEADLPPPKVTDSPERIWLNYGELERDDTHAECSRHRLLKSAKLVAQPAGEQPQQ